MTEANETPTRDDQGRLVFQHPKLGTVTMDLEVYPHVQFSHHLWSSLGYEGTNFIRRWQEEIKKIDDCFFVKFTCAYQFPRRHRPRNLTVLTNTVRGSVSWNDSELKPQEVEAFHAEFADWFRVMTQRYTPVLRGNKVAELHQSVQKTVDSIMSNLKPVLEALGQEAQIVPAEVRSKKKGARR